MVVGSGTPAIILVNGSGGPIEGWHKVLTPLGELSTVFAYNRPGIGGSRKPVAPQTVEHMADTLRALLRDVGLSSPHVLVGHSLGGLIVHLFARQSPSDVAAIVMLDATAPEDPAMMADYETLPQRIIRRTMGALFSGDANAETTHVAGSSTTIERAGPFPAVPLLVVTGGKPAMAWATAAEALARRAEHQQKMARLSPYGRQIIAEHSGHFPQFTEPEIVIAAVREALTWARAARTS